MALLPRNRACGNLRREGAIPAGIRPRPMGALPAAATTAVYLRSTPTQMWVDQWRDVRPLDATVLRAARCDA